MIDISEHCACIFDWTIAFFVQTKKFIVSVDNLTISKLIKSLHTLQLEKVSRFSIDLVCALCSLVSTQNIRKMIESCSWNNGKSLMTVPPKNPKNSNIARQQSECRGLNDVSYCYFMTSCIICRCAGTRYHSQITWHIWLIKRLVISAVVQFPGESRYFSSLKADLKNITTSNVLLKHDENVFSMNKMQLKSLNLVWASIWHSGYNMILKKSDRVTIWFDSLS